MATEHDKAHGWYLVQTLLDRHRPYDKVVAVNAHVCSLVCLRRLAEQLEEQVKEGSVPMQSFVDVIGLEAARRVETWSSGDDVGNYL